MIGTAHFAAKHCSKRLGTKVSEPDGLEGGGTRLIHVNRFNRGTLSLALALVMDTDVHN
jgi:hypothetical protein